MMEIDWDPEIEAPATIAILGGGRLESKRRSMRDFLATLFPSSKPVASRIACLTGMIDRFPYRFLPVQLRWDWPLSKRKIPSMFYPRPIAFGPAKNTLKSTCFPGQNGLIV